MKNLIKLFSFILALSVANAQNFNGSIEFSYSTSKDSITKVYWVKNKMIKLDEHSEKGKTADGSFIINLDSSKVKCILTKRKLWMVQKNQTPQVIKGKCNVKKGTATKTIAGISCVEYTVANAEENTSVTFWIADDNFTFFAPLNKLWNRKDKHSVYFAQIKDLTAGQMPLMSEVKQLSDGKLLSKIEVKKISKMTPDDAIFEIPAGFTKFRH
ncbi:MAG: DUF4412 domain-containing protein [Bacteroidia bacterium]|nr:DUF4412 domain-containing protein [Bacteroidia bacterium]